MSVLVSLRGMLRLIRFDTLRRVQYVGFLGPRSLDQCDIESIIMTVARIREVG